VSTAYTQRCYKKTRQFPTLPRWEVTSRGKKWYRNSRTRWKMKVCVRERRRGVRRVERARSELWRSHPRAPSRKTASLFGRARGDTIRSMLFIGKLWIIHQLIRPPSHPPASLSSGWHGIMTATNLEWHRAQHRAHHTPLIPSRDLHRRRRVEYINIWFHLSGSKLENILLRNWLVTYSTIQTWIWIANVHNSFTC
jgi:hypothetical protein